MGCPFETQISKIGLTAKFSATLLIARRRRRCRAMQASRTIVLNAYLDVPVHLCIVTELTLDLDLEVDALMFRPSARPFRSGESNVYRDYGQSEITSLVGVFIESGLRDCLPRANLASGPRRCTYWCPKATLVSQSLRS